MEFFKMIRNGQIEVLSKTHHLLTTMIDDEESEGENTDSLLSDEKMTRILNKLLHPDGQGHYQVRKVLKRHLPTNDALCDRMIEHLKEAVSTSSFYIGHSLAYGLFYSKKPSKIVGPLMELYTAPDCFDVSNYQGELMAELGVEAIPYIAHELHRHRAEQGTYAGVMALGILCENTGLGKPELKAYLDSLSESEWGVAVSDAMLSDELLDSVYDNSEE